MKRIQVYFKFFVFLLFYLAIPHVVTSQAIEKLADNNWWTMSNLNIDIPGSYCYNDSAIYCQRYGRLYTWEAAHQVCSSLGEDWHVPSTSEWNELLKHYGGAFESSVCDGKTAFTTMLRKELPTFGATLAGNRNIDGTYGRIEGHGFYWTATELDPNNAGFLNYASGKKVLFIQPDMEKIRAISVRCVKGAQ